MEYLSKTSSALSAPVLKPSLEVYLGGKLKILEVPAFLKRSKHCHMLANNDILAHLENSNRVSK